MSQSLSLTKISPITSAPRWPLVVGAILAVLVHAGLIAYIVYYSVNWQPILNVAEDTPASVPVDLVTVADKTNIAPTVERTPPKPVEAPAPPPQPVPPPPAPQADDDAEPAPVPSQPVVPKPAPPPRPIAKPQPAPAAPPAPTPSKQAKRPKADAVDSLLDNLLKPAPPRTNARVADRTVKGAGLMNAATMDISDALNSQMARCWTRMEGTPHPETLRPMFHLTFSHDGHVVGMPQLSAETLAAESGNPYLRAAAEHAYMAILQCQPYSLPPEKFEIWHDMTMEFSPPSD